MFLLFTQLYVAAYDTAQPENKAKTLLTITVLRNPGTPSFGVSDVQLNVFENETVGFTIYQLQIMIM